MKSSVIIKMTTEEVKDALLNERESLAKMKMQHAISPLENPMVLKEKRKDVNLTLVTDVFLDKRKEQFDVLQNNFPELGNTFLGILSVLDKSLSKPKLDKLVFLTSPNSILEIFTDFKKLIGLPNTAFSYLLEKADLLANEKIIALYTIIIIPKITSILKSNKRD